MYLKFEMFFLPLDIYQNGVILFFLTSHLDNKQYFTLSLQADEDSRQLEEDL